MPANSNSLEKGQERQLTLQLGRILGLDVRPSRVFFWFGSERNDAERIVSLARRPRILRRGRPRRFVRGMGVEASYLGNPIITVTLAVWGWFRHFRRLKRRV
jgi:hypothetical protein